MPTYVSTTMGPLEYYNSTSTATTCYTSPNSLASLSRDDTIQQALEHIDKHVDELEGDIDFFNKEREKQAKTIQELINANINQDKIINKLQADLDAQKLYTNWLESKIKELGEKINGYMP